MGCRLNTLLAVAGLDCVAPEVCEKFEAFLGLLVRWNSRMNLTAVREEEGILGRHFVESIACAQYLPAGIASVLDFGSGAGFPGIPIALCRPEVGVTLCESQGKKAAFLREAVRVLEIGTRVFGGRGETLAERFDCVTVRAVDRMGKALAVAGSLVKVAGWLGVMTTADGGGAAAGLLEDFAWDEARMLPGGERRVLLLGRRLVE